MRDTHGRVNHGWRGGKVQKHAEPIEQTPTLGVAIPGKTKAAVTCPLCGKAAWPLSSGFAHIRVERGPFDAGYQQVCTA